ncbi:hypothetical protein [Priestia megaterium]|uniref:hypothetical protein n=1 Tax=Priestia megaterium TaxID=1404 RepID=UPI0031019422
MNLTYKQDKKIKKKPDVYIILFILVALYSCIAFTLDHRIIQGLASLVFSFVVIYFSELEKVWALVVVKLMVWLHILMLIVVAALFFTHKI